MRRLVMHIQMSSIIDKARSQFEDAKSSVRDRFQGRSESVDATIARGLG